MDGEPTGALTVLGVILARGGSRRVPRKNLKMLGGRELIAWTIEAARRCKTLDYCLVSTNDDEIRTISIELGWKPDLQAVRDVHVPFKRPEELGEDVDSILPTIDAIERYEKKNEKTISHVVILQPTSPFRTPEDIDRCVQIAKTTGVDTVFSVTKVSQHPYWMFAMKAFGHEMESFMNVDMQGDALVSQNLPLLFYPNGAIYVVRRNVAMAGRIYGDRIYGYMMPTERSIDLEEEYDFLVGEALIPYLAKKEPYAKISWVIP